MPAFSAGLCMYRVTSPGTGIEVLIVHPGGPFWKNKNEGAWSLPKGEYDPVAEDALDAACREFTEELGHPCPAGPFIELGETALKSGKRILAWGVSGDLDVTTIVSNDFEIEWPPRSGQRARFPEVDKAQWCTPPRAKELLNPALGVLVDRLVAALSRQSLGE